MKRKTKMAWGVLALALAASGCISSPDLLLTEIGLKEVEIYNAEPGGPMDIDGVMLYYAATDGTEASIRLFGQLDSGAFLVVWEDDNHTGAPVASFYRNYNNQTVKGIKVEAGTFGTPAPDDGFAYLLKRRRTGFPNFIYTKETIEDVCRFGAWDPNATPPVERPTLGSNAFTDTGALVGDVRTETTQIKAKTIQRRWRSGVPRDGNSEDDWSLRNESYGDIP